MCSRGHQEFAEYGRPIVRVTEGPSSTAHLDCGRRTGRGSTRWLAGNFFEDFVVGDVYDHPLAGRSTPTTLVYGY